MVVCVLVRVVVIVAEPVAVSVTVTVCDDDGDGVVVNVVVVHGLMSSCAPGVFDIVGVLVAVGVTRQSSTVTVGGISTEVAVDALRMGACVFVAVH